MLICSCGLGIQPALQPASRVHCNIAFGELVTNFPAAHIDSTIDSIVPVLLDILRDVPHIDFDRSLSWEGIYILTAYMVIELKLWK